MTGQQGRLATLTPYHDTFGRPAKEVLADLEQFCALVEKWQQMQNLVSRETVQALWQRHILDSLQLLPLISDHLTGRSPSTIVDIGSGGGFPAVPLAIALKGLTVHTHLIESRSRKAAFLKTALRELALEARVHTARIEDVNPKELGRISVVTARALAPLPLLFSYLHHLWQPGAKAFLHKGREYGEELKQADSVWRYGVVKHQSKIDPQGVILEISDLERIG